MGVWSLMLKMWSHFGLNKEEKTGVKLPSLRQGRAAARLRARHPRVFVRRVASWLSCSFPHFLSQKAQISVASFSDSHSWEGELEDRIYDED